ncbi:MAG: hypothetical protein A3D92_06720 [Bacteroidetes bacterium RIFCSPHIGHO2_02_FULL_44_7]|nr:MAG: hypothetical protein A3D92_06720 [Bacteroidetes bacterium RIFCSPHIGHO2_02_FULL_44_7]
MGFLLPNIESLDNYYDRGRFLLAWRISMAFTLIFLPLTIIYAFNNTEAALPAALAVLVSIISAIYLAITKNYKPLFWTYAIAGTMLTHFAMNYVLTYTHYVDFVWMSICIMIAFIGLGWLYGILFGIVNLLGVAYFFWFTLNKHIEVLQPKTRIEILSDLIEVLFAFFVITYLMRQFILFQSHSERSLLLANQDLEQQNQLVQAKNLENETLVKEIHHRVKNNLQIIISLLRMQSAELKSEESRGHFSEAINRIMTMSLIHQKLYGEKELSKVNLKSYLDQLVSEIVGVFPGHELVKIHIESNAEDLNVDTIVPLGLLINELVSNSMKHAFERKTGGIINLAVVQDATSLEVHYSDNGLWKESDRDSSSFGLELVDILTDQMNGKKEVSTDNGTHYRFILSDTLPV